MAIDFQPDPPKIDFQTSAAPPSTDIQPTKTIQFQPEQSKIDFQPVSTQQPSMLKKIGSAAVGAAKDTYHDIADPILKMGDVAMHPSHIVGKTTGETIGNVVNQALPFIPVAPEAKAALSEEAPVVERTADQLFQNSNLNTKDRIEMQQKLQTIQGIPEATFEKLQRYEESGLHNANKVKISPLQEPMRGYGVTENGEHVGVFTTNSNPKGNAVQINTSGIENKFKGKGYGIDAYRQVADDAISQGKELWSDTRVSPSAAKMYRGLKNKGYEVVENPQTVVDKDGDLVAKSNEPVFKITKPALTTEEQKIYKEYFEPIAKESKEHVEYLKSKGAEGYELTDENYTPRQVKGSGAGVDKILNPEAPKNLKGKSISTFANATKNRSFFAVDTAEGRKVVYADKDGQIFDAANKGEPIGFIDKGKATAGNEAEILGKPTTLQTAKIPEIESATKGSIEYHKNLLGTRVTNLMQLRRARRNVEMIENWKTDPEFNEHVRWKGSTEETPADFRYVNGLPREFEGAKFSPQLAEQLEDFLPRIKNDDALSKVEKVGRFTRASIFFWPITHMGNISYQYGMSKGLIGTALKLPSTIKNLAAGFRAVATQNKEYMKYLGEGASLPYANEVAKQFPDELKRAMTGELTRNPSGMQRIAAAFGYGNPIKMIKNIYAVSNKALWSYGDALAIARIKDLEATGLSTKEAIKEAERVMPSYRVPSRVAGQRWLSQGLQNPLTAEFGRYQYNVLNSFAEVAKSVKDPAQRAKGLDQLAFVAMMAAIGYPLLDKVAQKVTSNPNAEFKKSGAGKVLQNALDVPEGKKNVRQALMSSASPGMLTAPMEAVMNTNLYTGAPIYNDKDLQQGKFGRVGTDLGSFAAQQVGPLQSLAAGASGKTDAERFLEGLFMIQNPTPQQMQSRAKAQKYQSKEQMREANKRGF